MIVGVFDSELCIFQLKRDDGASRLPHLSKSLRITRRWRDALLAQCNDASDGIRALISGHRKEGAPLEEPHVAYLPLASVALPGSSGRIVGVAAAIPAAVNSSDYEELSSIVARVVELRLGRLGVCKLVRSRSDRLPRDLHSETWTAFPDGATHWATVTPMVFDRHPKSKNPVRHQAEVAKIVTDSCEAIGLPKPREVVASRVSIHLNVIPSHDFPPMLRKDGSARRHLHLTLVFDEPVVGPVILGAGRYLGYGLARPL